MKTRSLCAGAVRAFLISATAAILASCAPPLDSRGEGNLRIVLAGEMSSGARTISPEIEAGLSYKLYFSGPGGETSDRELEPGIKNITLTLSLGNWTIRAEAYQGEVLYGNGETTVTVEAGRTNDATIPMKTTAKEITAFSFAGPEATGIVDTDTKTIAVTVPYGTDVTDLVPTIVVSEGASVSPESGTAQDFTESVAYTVTAADGSTATWIVAVTAVSGTAKEITAFSFVSPEATGIVDTDTKTIAVTVPYGTAVINLTPTIEFEGSTIDPASGEAQDFTNSVAYTITAANGSTETWTVTVTKRDSHITVAEVEAYLASATGGTASNPVSLPVTLNLADSSGNGWAGLLGAIDTGNKYVALDLSACTMNGMTGTPGEFDPDSSISAGKSRIVSLVLPADAESIKAGTGAGAAFQNFTGLTSVTGVSIENIGDYAFLLCASLLEVNYPAVENIGAGAFAGCAGLTSVNLSAGLTNLGQQAFYGCTGLASITLPASLTVIGPNPFAGCTGLTITVAPGNPDYKVENGRLLTIDGTTLVGYPTATGTITLPGITTIGPFAFQDCDELVSIDLPNTTSIGDYAFDGCVALISMDLPSIANIEGGVFQNTGTTALTVTLGSAVPTLGPAIFQNAGNKTVTVKVPVGATAWTDIGVYDPTDPVDCVWWGNGFRGGGWDGAAMTGGTVNSYIALTIEQPDYLFVSDTGSNVTGNGSETAPYATVDKALTMIAAAYSDLSWPVDPQSVPVPAHIRITGTITETGTANAMVQIGNPGSTSFYETYPPIILEGDGTLNAALQNRVLLVAWADVTLRGSLTLTGGGSDMPGAGVMVGGSGENGRFTMEGGTITGNQTSSSYCDGGGVRVASGEFIMKGGTISNNHTYDSSGNGGGVAVSPGAPGDTPVFTMERGTIIGNTSAGNGGGVYVEDVAFTMAEGTIISDNEATIGGGGVYVGGANGSFIMSGGTISGNTTQNSGGGVLLDNATGLTFRKTGGAIYGDTNMLHDPGDPENTSATGNGHAVFQVGGGLKRNTNANETVSLDSAITGSGSGWE
jgi:hypothetical protein